MKIRACTTLDVGVHSALKQLCYERNISIDRMLANLVANEVSHNGAVVPVKLVDNPEIIDPEDGTIVGTVVHEPIITSEPVSSPSPNRW